jgi:hypothetical protein
MKRALFLLLVLLLAAKTSTADTFGKTDTGSGATYNDDVRGCAASPTYNGTATKMTAYITGWTTGEKIKLALYDASDDSFVAATEEKSTGGSGWISFNFSPTVTIYSAKTYLLAIYSDSDITMYSDSEVGEYPNQNNAGYPSWPDPVTTGTGTQFSVYCTYTAVTTVAGTRSRYSNGYRSSYRNRYN